MSTHTVLRPEKPSAALTLKLGTKPSKRLSLTWLSGLYSTNWTGPVPISSILPASSAGMIATGARGEDSMSMKLGVTVLGVGLAPTRR